MCGDRVAGPPAAALQQPKDVGLGCLHPRPAPPRLSAGKPKGIELVMELSTCSTSSPLLA